MSEEQLFLADILADPQDDAPRLVYADWLEELGDELASCKSEYLRLVAQIPLRRKPVEWPVSLRARLQALAMMLDADWLRDVSRLAIDNCGLDDPLTRDVPRFRLVCDRRWEDLQQTQEPDARFCEGCARNVFYCDSIDAAREHAWQGDCVAIDLSVVRTPDDLNPPPVEEMLMGVMISDALDLDDSTTDSKPDGSPE